VGVGGAPRNGDWLVRCYDAATGRVLWAERLEVAGSTDLAQDAVLVGRRLIVAGDAINLATSQGTNFDLDWLVRAYDAQTGALRWQDRIMGPSDDMGLAIASSGSAAIVVGTTGDFPFDMDTRVRAYRPTSGEILWQDTIEARNALSGVAVAAEGGRVYTSASARQSDNDWRVDARDPHRGRVRWEERIDSNPGNDDPGHKAIAFGAGGRLFVLGHAPRGTLVLRAHQGG
jgi:outer membrane protein assembly factor BamB